MGKKKWVLSIALIACLLVPILSYELLFAQSPPNNEPQDNVNGQVTPIPTNTINPTEKPTNGPTATQTATPNNNGNSGSASPTINPTTSPTNIPVPETSSPHEKDHEKASDYVWDNSEVISVMLSGNAISTSVPNTSSIQGSNITITSAGTYKISGTLADGQVIVDVQNNETVRLILSNVDISCSSNAPIYVMNAKKTILVLEETTLNTVKDTSAESTADPNAAIFSTSDLTIFGTGQLVVWGNNDAIASKDGLIIKSGTITVTALDDGIRGKDYLIIKDGTITVTSGGDGLKSDNANDTTRGYVDVENGVISISSGGDAIEAQSDVTITAGQLTLTSGGGSGSTISAGSSAKGIKAIINVTITNGAFTINSADDCLHSNRTLTINSGTFALQTGDDAMHADKCITINGGTINVASSYEGIESTDIIINAGTIYITSRDDGINGAGGNDGSGFQPGPGIGGPGFPGQGFVPGNRTLTINSGYIVVTTVFGSDGKDGDGIDINGPITMTGGYVIVNGPTFNGNSAIDWEGSFKMTGGFILGVGSSGMAMTAGPTSTQYALQLDLRNTRGAGTLINIQTNNGTDVLTFQASKTFQSIAFCSPTLTKGSTYSLYLGGSSTGTLKDGVYQNGTYSGGTMIRTFTIQNIVTKLTYL